MDYPEKNTDLPQVTDKLENDYQTYLKCRYIPIENSY